MSEHVVLKNVKRDLELAVNAPVKAGMARVNVDADNLKWLIEQAAKAGMYRDTLNYIAGNSHLTTDTLQEARDAANGVLEESGE